MDYPRLALQWRTQPVESAGGLASAGRFRSAAFARGYTEQTESREQFVKKCRPDPEPTEEMLTIDASDAMMSDPDTGNDVSLKSDSEKRNGASSTANGRSAVSEITHPIALGRQRSPIRAPPIHIHVADDDENSAELVDLVVEQQSERVSVTCGETLAGRYVIIEKVSHCGMGLVYKALDQRREKAGLPVPWVALKFASSADGRLSSASTYLRQEFQKLSQLNHPNIVSVFDYDSDGGVDFIVMEWLDGKTLASLLTQLSSKRVALGKAREIVRSVGKALAQAHSLGIVHGDVKPSNVFLTDNRAVKLLDFGSSGQAPAHGESEPNWATRAYASCQVLRGELPQPHDDVFALGVTAYFLLSGDRPFGDLDAVDAQMRDLAPMRLPHDAMEFWPAVSHALQFEGANRPANAQEFLLEFSEPPADTYAMQERSQLEHIAYGAVAVALLIALVAWTVGSVGGLSSDEQDALQNAQSAIAEGQLVEPPGESALALYSSVLAAAPGNAEALDGLNRIVEEYLVRARDALATDDLEGASANLAIAKQVVPDHFGIAVTEDLVARYAKDLLVRAREAARSDPARAERLLGRATSLLPAEDAGLSDVRQELARLKIDNRIESLLDGIDERILAERLTLPAGDSAVDLLRQARELAPHNRQVAVAADRIATALLFQSMFAISNGELEDAQSFIEAARALDVKHLALARAQYELAKARHESVRTRRR